MRVAVTVEQSWHAVPGGIATATVELLRALVERSDVDIVGVAARHDARPRPDLVPPVPVRHVRLRRRALYASWQWLRWPPVERATGRVDVVHDMAYVVPPAHAPVVATVHDLLFLAFPDLYTARSRAVLRRGLALARRGARLVVCPSRATMLACREAGIEEERLRLVPWGVRSVSVTSERAAAVRARYALDRPYVLFCGTVEPRKNLRRVLLAFGALEREDVELVIVGADGWKEDLGPELRALDGRARRVGVVRDDELPALYSGAAAVAYVSLAEGFGLPVLEAMAYGAPVLTSAGTAMEELAGDAALLVDPHDVDAIGAGLARLLDDRRLARGLAERGRERARAFTWDRSAELVEAVYREAAGRVA